MAEHNETADQDRLTFAFISNIKKRLDDLGRRITEDKLIKFDHKVLGLLLISFLLFVFLVIFKIHGSSIPYWNRIISDNTTRTKSISPAAKSRLHLILKDPTSIRASDIPIVISSISSKFCSEPGLIFGIPQGVRSDEWLVETPFILSQCSQHPAFPLKNESLGAGNTPLLMNLPVRHFSTIFRPQFWGFFTLGTERGFSFYWNVKIFGLILGFFFLLMLITGNNFWLSLFGSGWLYFSSFVQWWFSTSMPDIVANFSIMFISLAYIFLSKKKSSVLIGSVLLTWSFINFVLFFYPPFQIPLVYLLLFLFAGYLIMNLKLADFRNNLGFRIVGFFGAGVISLVVLYLFYLDAKATIAIVMNTAYPGRRVTVGGDMTLAYYFSGFYDVFLLNHSIFPPVWGNICEASNFVLLFPVVLLGVMVGLVARRKGLKTDILLLSSLSYLVFLTIWMFFKLPVFFAKATLLNFVQTNRAFLGLGVGSIIASVHFLSNSEPTFKDKHYNYLVLLLIFIAMFYYGTLLRNATGGFFGYRHVILISSFITLISYLLLNKKWKAFSVLVFLFVFIPTFSVNPVSIGLGPIYGKEVSKLVHNIAKEDPKAEWVTFGNNALANFLKASGANVFNGVKYAPDLQSLKILDPGLKHKSIYNRYAHIEFQEPYPKSGKEIKFILSQNDAYIVRIDPCSKKLKQLGIKYLAFAYKPNDRILSCMEPVTNKPVSGIWIYRYK